MQTPREINKDLNLLTLELLKSQKKFIKAYINETRTQKLKSLAQKMKK